MKWVKSVNNEKKYGYYKNMARAILLFIALNQIFQVCQPLIRDGGKVSSREKGAGTLYPGTRIST